MSGSLPGRYRAGEQPRRKPSADMGEVAGREAAESTERGRERPAADASSHCDIISVAKRPAPSSVLSSVCDFRGSAARPARLLWPQAATRILSSRFLRLIFCRASRGLCIMQTLSQAFVSLPGPPNPVSRRRACPIWPSASHSLPSCVMLAKSESVTWMRG